jgi:Formate/nitrite transporter
VRGGGWRRRAAGSAEWSDFVVGNLLPVTIGNIVGGAILVGLVYWFVYLRGPVGAQSLTGPAGDGSRPDVGVGADPGCDATDPCR